MPIIRVKSKNERFRRGGLAFTREARELDIEALTPEQLEGIERGYHEGMLLVETVLPAGDGAGNRTVGSSQLGGEANGPADTKPNDAPNNHVAPSIAPAPEAVEPRVEEPSIAPAPEAVEPRVEEPGIAPASDASDAKSRRANAGKVPGPKNPPRHPTDKKRG